MLYKIILHQNGVGKIYVTPQFYIKQIGGAGSIVIRAGLRKEKADVVPIEGLRQNEIKITADVLNALCIPLNILYQIKTERDGIRIGPVIGLMLAQSKDYLTEKRLENFLVYASRYNEIHGLLYVFSIEGINLEETSVEGFYYNPGAKGSKPKWEKGVFPIPDSIFRRVGIPDDMLNILKRLTENRLFNSYYFNKWEFWDMASNNDPIKDNIPYTRMFRSFKDIDYMLALYDSLYLKPINGTLGNGIVKVTKSKDSYSFQSKDDKDPVSFTSRDQAAEYTSGIVSGRGYLIQQDIHLLKNKGQFVDFRVNMQKGYGMKWGCTGIITCTGATGGIHSNYSNEGEYLVFEDFMMKNLSISEDKTNKKKYEIIELCKKTCEMLDESGENYGDLGIDVGFDVSLKPWVFEVNKSQFHYLPLMINDYGAYYNAKTNPVKYAAALSGFGKAR